MYRSLAVVVILSVLALALGLWICSPYANTPQPATDSGVVAAVASERTESESKAPAAERRPVSTGIEIVVVDQAGRPVPNAAIQFVGQRQRLLSATTGDVIAVTDRRGFALVDQAAMGAACSTVREPFLLCEAEGHAGCSQRIVLGAASYVFRLQNACDVSVRFLTAAGAPVPDVLVVASSAPFNHEDVVERVQATKSWTGASGAICHSRSNASGWAVLRGLAPGSYVAWAEHAAWLPTNLVFTGEAPLEVDRPQVIDCSMAPIVAAVANCARRGVVHASIVVPTSRVGLPQSLSGALGRVKRQLQARLRRDDGMLVASVGIGLGDPDSGGCFAEGTVKLLGADGGVAQHKVRYVALGMVGSPPQEISHGWGAAPCPTILVDVVTVEGEKVLDVPVTLTPIAGDRRAVGGVPLRVEASVGQPAYVWPGRWRVEFAKESGLIGGVDVAVAATDAVRQVLTLSANMVKCVIRLRDADGMSPPVRFGVYRGQQRVFGGLTTSVVWNCWLEPGAYVVRYAIGVDLPRSHEFVVRPQEACHVDVFM